MLKLQPAYVSRYQRTKFLYRNFYLKVTLLNTIGSTLIPILIYLPWNIVFTYLLYIYEQLVILILMCFSGSIRIDRSAEENLSRLNYKHCTCLHNSDHNLIICYLLINMTYIVYILYTAMY